MRRHPGRWGRGARQEEALGALRIEPEDPSFAPPCPPPRLPTSSAPSPALGTDLDSFRENDVVVIRAVHLQSHFLPSKHKVGYLSIPIEVRREQVICSGHEIPSAKVVLPLRNSPLNSSFCPQVELSALPVAARDSCSLYFHTSGGRTHTELIFVASRCPAQCWNIQ